ncbi:MAG: type II toxin-antitoxin system RatA family toxin [Gammaproteobacteria bacterium]
MTVVRRTAFAPFTAAQMYHLVNDVEAYPGFLPWCDGAVVLAREPALTRARLTVRKGRFHYSFTTANRLVPERSIALDLVDGPFSRFHGAWHFVPADGGCTIDFNVEFEFANRIVGRALAAAFKPIADSMVDAFKRRAYVVYPV